MRAPALLAAALGLRLAAAFRQPGPADEKAEKVLTIELRTPSAGREHGAGPIGIPGVAGELGHALRQLAWAFMYAEGHGYTSVTLPEKSCERHFTHFLTVVPGGPKVRGIFCTWFVHNRPAGAAPVNCWSSDTKFTGFKCSAEPQEMRRILQKYLIPMLSPAARFDRRRGDPDELVIYMGGEDAMTIQPSAEKKRPDFEMQMLPCAVYDKVIKSGFDGNTPFKSVRIVTEGKKNPCVREVQQRHASTEFRVQRRSNEEEDAAAILNARYLVVDHSYFPMMMALLSEELRGLWYSSAALPDLGPPGEDVLAPNVTTFALEVPGLRVIASPKERAAWMVGYGIEQVKSLVPRYVEP